MCLCSLFISRNSTLFLYWHLLLLQHYLLPVYHFVHSLLIYLSLHGCLFCKIVCILCYLCQVENLVIEIPFPKTVLNASLTPSQGKYSFDPVSKVMTWDAGKIDTAGRLPNIKGNVSFCTDVFLLVDFSC